MKKNLVVFTTAMLASLLGARSASAQYTVEWPRPFARGHLWVSEGPVGVFSSNSSAGHRFRIGGELHLGSYNRFIFGWTFYDRIYSGESSTSSGDLSRDATDLNFGYFIIPDKLFVEYTLAITSVSGSTAIGSVTALGHQPSIGYRFFSAGIFNLAAEASYMYIEPYVATTFDYNTNATSSVKFPAANVWGLSLRMGIDLGG